MHDTENTLQGGLHASAAANNKHSAGLNALASEIHKNAVEHGWWENERAFPEILALCHSELSEALEEHRKGHAPGDIYYACQQSRGDCRKRIDCNDCKDLKPEGIPIELADGIIRILDYCGYAHIDIEAAIRIKHRYNATRSYRHGGKKC